MLYSGFEWSRCHIQGGLGRGGLLCCNGDGDVIAGTVDRTNTSNLTVEG